MARAYDANVRDAARQFAEGGAGAAEIAKSLGVAPSTVRRWMRAGKWKAAAIEQPARKDLPHFPDDESRMRMVQSIFDRELALAEARLCTAKAQEGEGGDESARAEKRARTLTALMRVFEKAMEMKHHYLEDAARTDKADEDLDAEELRAELKRRLDRLLAETGVDGVDREPDGE